MVVSILGGIIPARAGFTAVTQGVSGYVKDHPRSRGVYDSVSGAVIVP